MKKLIALLLLLTGINYSYAQHKTIELWPGQVPGETAAKHPAVLRDTLKQVTRITDITDPLLTVYPPASLNLHAAIIVSAGGGNKYLAIDMEGYEVAQWLSSLGYTAFVLNYRVPDKPAGSLQDLQRAVSLVRAEAGKYNLSPDKIGVMGFSAGGNLSARAITNFTNRTYIPVDKSDSLSCRPDFALLIYPGSLSTGADHHLIPEVSVTNNTPPTFIFVAADDQFGPPLSLAQALRDNKVPFEFHIFPKGGHGYGLRKGNPAAEAWPALAAKWLADYGLKR